MAKDSNEPLFSVVIPAYNAARWIGQTLESWARQTIREFEVIVVDDGSDDETVAVAKHFRSRIDLRVIRAPRSGAPARPCNIGIRAARGTVIVHCDADDLCVSDRLERIRDAWEIAGRAECLIFSDFAEIDTEGIALRERVLSDYSALERVSALPLSNDIALLSADGALSALIEGAFIRPCSAATTRKAIEAVGGFDERLRNGQDYDLYVRIARQYPFLWIKHCLGLYRIVPGSISSRSAIQLAPSKLAVLNGLLKLPLTASQASTVRRMIALNYESLGYEYGNVGQTMQSLSAYGKAFMKRPSPIHLRGMAASVTKRLLGHAPRIRENQ